MTEAIDKFQKQATTVTERSEDLGYKSPAVVICSYPMFKPSISNIHGFKYLIKYLYLTDNYFLQTNINVQVQ